MKKLFALIVGLCLTTSAWGYAPKGVMNRPAFQNITKTPVDIISDRLVDIIGEKYISGMWFFDARKSVIEDRGIKGNKVLTGTAPPPDKDGLLPVMPFNGTSTTYWRSASSKDFSFGNNATDKPFTIIVALKPQIASAVQVLLAQWDTDAEYNFYVDASDKILARCYKSDASAWIGRSYNTAITADNGQFRVYVFTYSGSGADTGIKIFRQGTRIDDTAATQAGYVAMKGTVGRVGNYYAANYFSGKYYFAAVISRELNEKEVLDVSNILISAQRGSLKQ